MQFAVDRFLRVPGPELADIQLAVLAILLVAAAVIDLRTFRIPNWLTGSGVLLGLAFNAIGHARALDGLLSALGGMGIGLTILLPFYLLRVMGAGDVKLMAMVGAFLGLSQIVPAVLFSFIAGGVAAVVFVVAKRRIARFGSNLRHIVQGAALSAIAGLPLAGLAPGASVGHLPYGVSISAGTILYLASLQLGYL